MRQKSYLPTLKSSTLGAEDNRMIAKRLTFFSLCLFCVSYALAPPLFAQTHLHTPFDELLQKHVVTINDGKSTQVDYAELAKDKTKLEAYLSALAAIDIATFEEWSQGKQLAFLINAYNTYTLALIIEHYPDIGSIRDIGGFFSSPWKQAFAPLLGKTRTLDNIEHGLIRGDNKYQEPRIHFAVNCASIGCPALREEAYTEAKLSQQLESQTQRFLSDNSRHYIEGNTLKVSKIFDWYRDDFEAPWRGATSLNGFLLLYVSAFDLTEAQQRALRAGTLNIEFSDYDWALNDRAK